jgi:hypothetical protein
MRILPDRVAYVRRNLARPAVTAPGSEPPRATAVTTFLSPERGETSQPLRHGIRSLEHWLDLNA